MMQYVSVALFGHRKIDNLSSIDQMLVPILKEIIHANSHVVFMIGRNGEFDEYAASVIKQVQKETGEDNSELTLVLPYTVADLDYYAKYYDNIIIPDNICNTHPKAAITYRNRWMVEHADLVIVYVERNTGGAYTAMKYAEKLNKTIKICHS